MMKIRLAAAALVLAGCIAGSVLAADKPVPACEAANNEPDYGQALTFPAEVRSLIDNYRAEWRAFCKQTPPGPVTLAHLYALAGRISESFDKLLYQPVDGAAFEKGRRPDDLLRTVYPRFVPAFEGSYEESTFFAPSTEGFRAYAARGSTEDRLFFDSGMPLTDHLWDKPWLDPTWDYGGCLLFGKFDWVGEAQKVARLKQELRSEAYVKQLVVREESFFSQLEEIGTQICTCDRKDAVLEDYQKLARALETEPGLAAHLPKLRRMIAAIQSSQVRVSSDQEQHCSGG